MENLSPEEESISKDMKNILRLKKKKKITPQLKICEIFLDRKKKLK